MSKRVFFSFDYKDVADFRANVVRNHWMTKPDREEAGFFDASIWEEAEKKEPENLKRLIKSGLDNTSVTAVLVGSRTADRRWVRYEIFASLARGNKLLAVHINGIKSKQGYAEANGMNPFDVTGIEVSADGKSAQPIEYNGSGWIISPDAGSYTLANDASSIAGRRFQLSHWYSIYDWTNNDGYNNFSTWIGA